MQWYYLDAQRQQVQTDEAGLRRLFAEGAIGKDTMVWNETMTEWLPLADALPGVASPARLPAPVAAAPRGDASGAALNPYSAPLSASATAAGSGTGNVRAFAAILAEHGKWAKFCGILLILYGVLNCVTIIGALWGWVFIWMGTLVNRMARLADEAKASGSVQGFNEALESVGKFFKISGIMGLIGLILTVLYIGAVIVVIVVGAAASFDVPTDAPSVP
jgi:hypothetical protein